MPPCQHTILDHQPLLKTSQIASQRSFPNESWSLPILSTLSLDHLSHVFFISKSRAQKKAPFGAFRAQIFCFKDNHCDTFVHYKNNVKKQNTDISSWLGLTIYTIYYIPKLFKKTMLEPGNPSMTPPWIFIKKPKKPSRVGHLCWEREASGLIFNPVTVCLNSRTQSSW